LTEAAPRVAFFPDTYQEIDGVANTSRQFEAFVLHNGLPFLTVCGGDQNSVEHDGTLTRLTFRRGPIGFPVDKKHTFDLLFWRHYRAVEEAVRKFNPDVLHITGPSDVGQLGALVAHRLRVPLAASWHTNLHEYAEQRTAALVRWLPGVLRTKLARAAGKSSLRALLRFYKIARLLFAPNQELIELLERGTGKACYPMQRGVNTTLFDPNHRDRTGDAFVLGYVGRLTSEKDVRFLANLEKALRESGMANFRFHVVGQGAEEPWLKANMHHADFLGVLKGEALARAYANMDVFVFPSRTDTYGNVVVEALASGLPAIVTDSGGPRFIVQSGETGFVAKDLQDFVSSVQRLAADPVRLQRMRTAARDYALSASWDRVFESVYARYDQYLKTAGARKSVEIAPRPFTPSPHSHPTIL
jgi:phosphatidylinositol alpha 1,6-mannosyltransferase